MKYFYLYGFASSPRLIKAQDFKKLFAKMAVNLLIPELNQGIFFQ